ncbi:MAG TPA: major capsid protein [Pyrinomonadaceae bacterium]|nr:major capsid protein [Pyrinomonadaceae bacterium]
MSSNDGMVFPEDLTTLSTHELITLQRKLNLAFDELASVQSFTDSDVSRMEDLAEKITAVTAMVTQKRESASAETTSVDETDQPIEEPEPSSEVSASTEMETETPTKEGKVSMDASKRTAEGLKNVSLASVQEQAPEVVPDNRNDSLVVTAAAPRYGLPTGSRLNTLEDLVSAVQTHAKSQVVTAGSPQFLTVASIANQFDHVIDGQGTSVREFEAMTRSLRDIDPEALVAGGGWCAPSEIRYNFFNVTCEDGMIDLPTFGVQRGGIQHPVSPSLADVFTGTFTNATNPWLWTEADDILTVTGTPDKPCVRVTCPSFTDRRLECYGICLTAGNLTDSAYPEATRNHLSLLMSAHFHAMNQRFLATMVSLSSAATSIPVSGAGILADAPAYVGLAAQDYRTRYGMCDSDVLEVVFPRWVRDAMRTDHLRRTGFWEGALTDADIDALFARFRVRVQWVQDWQVRATGQPGAATAITDWPANVTFMIYAAGTFLLGNGMSLDLGVVRDSVLNAENDHTAAWTEECHLIARVGHESRQYTIPVCVAGRTGAANIVCADV